MKFIFRLLPVLILMSCFGNSQKRKDEKPQTAEKQIVEIKFDTSIKTIHVLVALCDNKYQGILPVPKGIGNGQDPESNLYWGCDWGVKTFFKKSKEWQLIKKEKKDSFLMERLIFKHVGSSAYLIADAYNGKDIKQCTQLFLQSCAGGIKDTVHVNNLIIGIQGNASLLAYIGHDGLMDFKLPDAYNNEDGKTRDCIILACASKNYFSPYIKNAKADPLVWTTDLMCPEAYTLHDALSAYLNKESKENIRERAAAAYAKYQKCSLKAAKGLLVSGW